MKKNIRRKLALSALSAGVALLSVTATTYAWFTSNTEAEVTGIKGTAEAVGSSLLIGQNATSSAPTTWGAKVTFADISGLALKPAQWTAADTYKPLDTSKADLVKNQDFASYTVWFKVTELPKKGTKYLKLTLKDLDKDLTDGEKKGGQVLVADAFKEGTAAANQTNLKAGDTLADKTLSDAMQMEILTPVKDSVSADVSVAFATTGTNNVGTKNIFKLTPDDSTVHYDALTYYNNVMGTSYTRTAYTNQNSVALWNTTAATPAGNTIVLAKIDNTSTSTTNDIVFSITFNFFLDGWDQECFNAVATKKFAAGLQFELVDSVA